MRKLQNKKQGVPWDCFLSYRFSHNLQTSYETTLDKTQPYMIFCFILIHE